MKEKELREKMAGLYGAVPADTHAAYEHALTHHRQQESRAIRVSKVRIAVVVALLVMLLATGAYAVYARFSVTEFMHNTTQEFLDHMITLDETYANDLFTMTVNDLMFDGLNFAVAMNIVRNDPDIAYYMRTKVTATCAGKDYLVDVEGWSGPDFLAGGMWPEYDLYTDPQAAEQRGFGFDGILVSREDWMSAPPAGEPVDWTMTFTVFRPLWEIVLDNSIYDAPDFDAAVDARCLEAWRNQQIFMYSGDANTYVAVVAEELGLPWELPTEELLPATGAFELADVITFRFTTNFDDNVVRKEVIGQRYDLGTCTAVLDNLQISFQRVIGSMILDLGREMSREEMAEVVPNWLSVVCRNAAGEVVWESDRIGLGTGYFSADLPEHCYSMGFDFHHDAGDIASMTFQGGRLDYATGVVTPWEDFVFTIDLSE